MSWWRNLWGARHGGRESRRGTRHGGRDSRRGTRDGGRATDGGILVHPVNTDVLAADLSRLKELTDDSQLWKAILHVLGSKQQVLLKRAMTGEALRAMGQADGVGVAIAELDAWRCGRKKLE